MKVPRAAHWFRMIARFGTLIISVLVIVFALFSGAEEVGIWKNSPNALPWLALLLASLWAWKNEVLGGTAVLILGFAMLYYFNFSGPNFFIVTLVLCLIIITLGFFFVASAYLRKKARERDVQN